MIAIDASAEMVSATRRLTGLEARLLPFEALEFDCEFDGIWACASLLHIARQDLDAALARLTRALKPGAVLYLSFKYGDSERVEGGRFFHDLNEAFLEAVLARHPQLEVVRVWTTNDVRNERRGGQRWLNAIARRGNSTRTGEE